ncbi:SRPBCC family protein [Flavobacterium amniphilum]|uniref:SRPBCC family protein n=1 Tax=Flavobacterium amniphilum TaxID=1834035 RepID=UPI00202A8C37|nr:SRPBCC family protein [Flavobacterium amniphilum]MCL9805263.1 SRPBCC family protein [Flavobacterium amniphilum]
MLYSIHSSQKLPVSLEDAWNFFSDPKNLNTITPDNMNFKTLSGDEKNMFQGQIIHYKITPFPFITIEWITEITHVEPLSFFVDEQRFGPYKFWHHKHFFIGIENGVLMEDIVHYKVPFGILGRLFHPILVKPKLDEIFAFRRQKLIELFGHYE